MVVNNLEKDLKILLKIRETGLSTYNSIFVFKELKSGKSLLESLNNLLAYYDDDTTKPPNTDELPERKGLGSYSN